MSGIDAAEYRLDYFDERGFQRRECRECGDFFWTLDPDRETCGEPPCGEYGFIDTPSLDREYSMAEMREAFLSYFEQLGHGIIDPYPVAAHRWRDDVLLTQASIYDFQPHVTSGKSPPPANPLAVSQPCIRMNDIDNVGKTGRHTMAFEMMGHHAFNADPDSEYAYEGEVYWKEECVQYCVEFFETLGVDAEEVVLIEDTWTGGGNAGPSFEVIYRGAELATLVFMYMETDPTGDIEIKGEQYVEMDRRIIDTGYGLERWTWVSQGTPTVYEAIYPEMIDFLKENAGLEHTEAEAQLVHEAAKLAGHMDIDEAEDMETARATIAQELDVDVRRLTALMEPLETIYAIADHCRTLAYMFGDGIVPSSAGAGYLARMVLRRTERLVDDVGVDAPLDELVDMQAERLGYENRDTIRDIVRTEERKYREALERGERRVRQLASEYAQRDEPIPPTELVELYDSHGLQPDIVEDIAAEVGASVDVPDDFYSLVAARHDSEADESAASAGTSRIEDLPETDRLYYDDQYGTEFEAMVLDVFEREENYEVVLDQTMFYPEGGGQPADHGTLSNDEMSVDVVDVQERNGVIFHRTTEDPGKGDFVRGKLDVDRRRRLMRHHTATHVIGHAAREVLGEHVRQAGAQKGTDSARLDITHYERLDPETIQEIERVANEIVMADSPVESEWPGRHEAEAEHGFDLYQGGIPTGTEIRLIHVDEDVQACAGTHVRRTGEIGSIKVRSTERVQDGVERLVFAAGEAAIEYAQETEAALRAAANTFDVEPQEVPATAQRFFEEWKERGKRIDELEQDLAEARASGDNEAGTTVEVGATTARIRRLDADIGQLRATANTIVEDGEIAVLASGRDGATFVVAVPDNVGVNAGEVVAELAGIVGGGGGGPPDFAEGGGPDVDALDEALDRAPDVLQRLADA
ncbi:MAG: alanine--tRNA ligase [Halobacteriaceae archaeon]